MGDDEDITQAKYDVMSLISDKIGGLDTRLERINQELKILIDSNERDITELRSEFDSDECTPFLITKCDPVTKTYEGCVACAEYWRGQKQLPENCGETIQSHCAYKNTYITQSSPGVTPVIGSPGTERESIKVGEVLLKNINVKIWVILIARKLLDKMYPNINNIWIIFVCGTQKILL